MRHDPIVAISRNIVFYKHLGHKLVAYRVLVKVPTNLFIDVNPGCAKEHLFCALWQF